MEVELKALMIAAQSGDRTAEARLLARLSGYLRAFFVRRLSAGADGAEDLVQETLLAIHLKRATYDPKLPFTPWAYAIARYKLIDSLRQRGRRVHLAIEDAGELLAEENSEEGAVRRDVARLLGRLPKRQRDLMRDVKIAGYSMDEAAARADMSLTAAKVSVHRAMKRLKREVTDEDL